MQRKIPATYLSLFAFLVLFVTVSIYLSRNVIPSSTTSSSSSSTINLLIKTTRSSSSDYYKNNLQLIRAIRDQEQDDDDDEEHHRRLIDRKATTSSVPGEEFNRDSILFPEWEVLVVVPPEQENLWSSSSSSSAVSDVDNYYWCLFQNNTTSPAKFAGILPSSNSTTFKCIVPKTVRRTRPLYHPIVIKQSSTTPSGEFPRTDQDPSKKMFRWGLLAYESLSTEDDVIVFAKGVNVHRGKNRSPSELRCLFSNGVNNSVTTPVTSSEQEVFRCRKPSEIALNKLLLNGGKRIKATLLEVEQNKSVPSVAYYTPHERNLAGKDEKALLCASTMVYNVGKFLREWVVYHTKIGVDKFILYDNGSDDNLQGIVEKLLGEGYNVKRLLWPWPKTQEAGFSHAAMKAKESCTWMMYIDVDEFIFSPLWLNSSEPSTHMLKALLPQLARPTSSSEERPSKGGLRQLLPVGQVMVRCLEFGPSNQRSHPPEGVIQGYTCRRRNEQRHKSIVLIDAIDTSLGNVVHHFQLNEGYRVQRLSRWEGIVNHYKYQAWSEFKNKFRRRVSAYVVDWKEDSNPMSRDRTPGLGFEAIEPKDWANQFCDENDTRLKLATQRWFGVGSSSFLSAR